MNLVVRAANEITDLKNSFVLNWIVFKKWLKDSSIKLLDQIQIKPGVSIIVFAMIFSLFNPNNMGTIYFWCAVLYAFVLSNRKIEYKREKDRIDAIDLNKLIGEDSIHVLLNEYVAQCFERDVLFFRGLQPKEYINTKSEKEMLDALLDSVSSNMSISLKNKLDMYYGVGRTDIILGRMCLEYVSLFVANNNKSIYPNK